MEVHCHLPIRIRLLGTPGEAELAQLSATVAAAVATRLDTARRLVTQRHGADAGRGPAAERFDADRGTGPDYAVASYDDRGRPVGVPVRRPAPPWTVLRALNFRTTVGDFFDWVERGLPQPLAERALYTDLDADVRWVVVWWVQTNRTLTLAELARLLAARAIQLSRLGPSQTIVHGVTPFDRGRLELADLDAGGQVRALPPLGPRNLRRVEGSGGEAVLLHGSRAVFASMVLPRIEAGDLLVLGTRTEVVVPLRDLVFLFDAADFERATGVAWVRFAEEFGAEQVTVTLQPATVRKPAATQALGYLLSVAARPAPTTAATESSGLPASRFWVLNQAALSTLPTPVRAPATDWTDPASLVLDGASVLDRLPAGARVLFAAAVLPVDRDRAVAAQARPTARLLATQLLGRLSGDPTEREWRWRLYGFLNDAFGSPPTLRPPGGTLFEHVLVVLEADGHLVELYDRVNASRFFGLRHRLLQHSLATRYADHPRVRRLLTELSERSLAATRAGYFPDADPPEIWLDGDSARRVRVGEVLGDRDSLYLSGKDLKELKPERAQQLRQACEQIRIEMHRQVAAGDDGTEYSDEAFATEVLTRAARAVKITEKDFAEITIQRSIKIVRVSRREVASLPSFEVAFRFVERRMGGSWVVVSDEVRESADDFEARLIYWALGRAGEVYEVIGLAISVVGLVAVAWSAGIVAALISLAGGGFAVGVSIGIAEVIYIFRVVFGDATWSVRGFLLAALEGYLMALGFRIGAGLGRMAADRLGTATLRRFLAGWVAQKLITGVVGGALSAGLSTFANDVVKIATGRGGWSSAREYVWHLGIGAAVGIVAEFALAPALNAALAKGGSALGSAADLARQIRAEGWSSVPAVRHPDRGPGEPAGGTHRAHRRGHCQGVHQRVRRAARPGAGADGRRGGGPAGTGTGRRTVHPAGHRRAAAVSAGRRGGQSGRRAEDRQRVRGAPGRDGALPRGAGAGGRRRRPAADRRHLRQPGRPGRLPRPAGPLHAGAAAGQHPDAGPARPPRCRPPGRPTGARDDDGTAAPGPARPLVAAAGRRSPAGGSRDRARDRPVAATSGPD